uniref:ATNAP9 n=1 Tax=Arundo donax TaxID=35708 RepID=A0A0A9GM09_ARUDO
MLGSTMCFPPSIFSIVVLPAPLEPTRRHRWPASREKQTSSMSGGAPGGGRPSMPG